MLNKPRILLVDDEPSMIMVVSKRLELAGFDVTTAINGQEALAKAHAGNPDLIVLDLMLPQLNGYEVCTMLKQDLQYKQIPIILLSAKSQEKDKRLGVECGADAYLTKPYKAEILLEQIQALLPTRPSPQNA